MDTIDVEYYYDDTRNIVMQIRSGTDSQRRAIKLSYFDESGRELKSVEWGYAYSSMPSSGSGFSLEWSDYEKDSRILWKRNESTAIDPRQFETLMTTVDMAAIEKIFPTVEANQSFQRESVYGNPTRMKYDRLGRLIESSIRFGSRRDFEKYEYGPNGLPSKQVTRFGVFDNITRYRYDIRR